MTMTKEPEEYMDAVTVELDDATVGILCGQCGDSVCDEDGRAIPFSRPIDAVEYAYRFEGWTFDDTLGNWCCGNHAVDAGATQ